MQRNGSKKRPHGSEKQHGASRLQEHHFASRSRPPRAIDTAQGERLAYLVGGGLLTFFGLTRRSLSGLPWLACGEGLLYCGLTTGRSR